MSTAACQALLAHTLWKSMRDALVDSQVEYVQSLHPEQSPHLQQKPALDLQVLTATGTRPW